MPSFRNSRSLENTCLSCPHAFLSTCLALSPDFTLIFLNLCPLPFSSFHHHNNRKSSSSINPNEKEPLAPPTDNPRTQGRTAQTQAHPQQAFKWQRPCQTRIALQILHRRRQQLRPGASRPVVAARVALGKQQQVDLHQPALAAIKQKLQILELHRQPHIQAIAEPRGVPSLTLQQGVPLP